MVEYEIFKTNWHSSILGVFIVFSGCIGNNENVIENQNDNEDHITDNYQNENNNEGNSNYQNAWTHP